MEKKVYLLTADLRKTTHRPMMIMDLTYQRLIEVVTDLANSPALKDIYADPKIERVIIFLYADRSGKFKRRIAHSPSGIATTDKEILRTIQELSDGLGIKMDFHTQEEGEKIVPADKAERDLIATIRKNGQHVDMRDYRDS